MTRKILILGCSLGKYISDSDDRITEIYRNPTDNKLLRIIRKLFLKISLFKSLIYGNWYNDLKKYDMVILFDTGNAGFIINHIKKSKPDIRIILWYWNPVDASVPITSIDRSKCEVWSYHSKDCQKYNLQKNTQFFINTYENISDAKIMQDVYFVGADKNRMKILSELKVELDKQNISSKFVLIRTSNSVDGDIPFSNPIAQQDNKENILSSKVIVDVVDVSYLSGFTLRPFEAAMYRKKLITNDGSIDKLKFYNTNNIFIIGKDDVRGLKTFVNTSYDDSVSKSLEYYEFNNWINRFL